MGVMSESKKRDFYVIEVALGLFLVDYSIGASYCADYSLFFTNRERYGQGQLELLKSEGFKRDPDEIVPCALQFSSVEDAKNYVERHSQGNKDDFIGWSRECCVKYGGDAFEYPKIRKVSENVVCEVSEDEWRM